MVLCALLLGVLFIELDIGKMSLQRPLETKTAIIANFIKVFTKSLSIDVNDIQMNRDDKINFMTTS